MTRARTVYLLLSGLSAVVELGVPMLALRSGASLTGAIVLVLCYQLAGLLKNPGYLPIGLARGILALAAGVAAVAGDSLWLMALATFLLAAGMQTVREHGGEDLHVSTPVKRGARIGGFAFAGLLTPGALPVLAIICVACSFALVGKGAPSHSRREWRPGWLGTIMVVHQAHYFCYASAIPALFLAQGLDPTAAALAFAAGWVSYTSTQLLFNRAPDVTGFVAGHALAAAMLAAIYLSLDRPLPLLLAWIGTGFGGGTVFLLRRRQASWPRTQADLDLWENVGHVAGVTLALTIVTAGGGASVLVLGAIVLVLVTGALMALSGLMARGRDRWSPTLVVNSAPAGRGGGGMPRGGGMP